MADERLKAWMRQARADWEVGRATSGSECHRRYWLQQACEKGIKALGILLWKGQAADESRFRQYFLHQHSPLKELADNAAVDPKFPKSLHLLVRQLETELGKIDGEDLLRKVDGIKQQRDASEVSYRYPFVDAAGTEIAPVDWKTSDWDLYQGNFAGVVAAIDRFLRAVEILRRQRSRAPS
jgi:hypothetical protein